MSWTLNPVQAPVNPTLDIFIIATGGVVSHRQVAGEFITTSCSKAWELVLTGRDLHLLELAFSMSFKQRRRSWYSCFPILEGLY